MRKINKAPTIKNSMIAPCGMNCGICMGHVREERKCPGCRLQGKGVNDYCRKCIIKKCKKRKNNYCYSCDIFPCRRLKQLDKRYRTKYKMSVLENLENIKKFGIRKFVKNEKKRWACSKCNGVICVHRGFCLKCDKK